jgi:hypothetical protein
LTFKRESNMKNGIIKAWNGVGYRRRQRGASLLEGIAYLGIAAIVILGAVSLLTSAFGNAQSNRATEEVISLRTAVRKLYVGQAYPAAGVVAVLINAGAVPSTLTNTAGAVTNSWGGAVTIVGSGAGAATNNFVITYNNVPAAECVNMLSGANGWTVVAVNGANAGTAAAGTIPVAAGAASTACNAPTNTVALTAV